MVCFAVLEGRVAVELEVDPLVFLIYGLTTVGLVAMRVFEFYRERLGLHIVFAFSPLRQPKAQLIRRPCSFIHAALLRFLHGRYLQMIVDLAPGTRVAVIENVWWLVVSLRTNGEGVLFLKLEEVLGAASLGVLTAERIQYKVSAVCFVFLIALLSVSELAGRFLLNQVVHEVLLDGYLDRALLLSQIVELSLCSRSHLKRPLLRGLELPLLNAGIGRRFLRRRDRGVKRLRLACAAGASSHAVGLVVRQVQCQLALMVGANPGRDRPLDHIDVITQLS